MAGNTATLTFAGDSKALEKAAQRATKATDDVGNSAKAQAGKTDQAAAAEKDHAGAMAKTAMVATGASSAVDGLSSSIQALADFQQADKERAAQLARAQYDVESAMQDGREAATALKRAQQDLTDAQDDGKRSGIDLEQAQTDISRAHLEVEQQTKAVSEAIDKYGKNSFEARSAALDLADAQTSVKSAEQDAAEAISAQSSAAVSAEEANNDMARSQLDSKGAALDLAEAQRAANPTWLQDAAGKAQIYGGALQGLVGTIALLTMAHEALNLSQMKATASRIAGTIATTAQTVATGIATVATAAWGVVMAIATSPITLIVVGVALLVGAIIYLATQTDFFQKTWDVIWNSIKATISFVVDSVKERINALVTVWRAGWDMVGSIAESAKNFLTSIPGKIGSAFSSIADTISRPFKSAFNWIADAWNNTVGRLSWTVPGWVPVVGGNTISAPKLPKFHSGGVVPGPAGAETLAILQAGEEVTSRGQAAMQPSRVELSVAPGADSALAALLMKLVRDGTLQLRMA
jgi:hypothetical protein